MAASNAKPPPPTTPSTGIKSSAARADNSNALRLDEVVASRSNGFVRLVEKNVVMPSA
jgi:hypothetical protein